MTSSRPSPRSGATTPTGSAYLRAVASVLVGEMHRQGVTRYRLAERTGLSRSQVGRLLSGRHSIQLDHLRLVASALLLCPCQVIHGIDQGRGHDDAAARRRAWLADEASPTGGCNHNHDDKGMR